MLRRELQNWLSCPQTELLLLRIQRLLLATFHFCATEMSIGMAGWQAVRLPKRLWVKEKESGLVVEPTYSVSTWFGKTCLLRSIVE